MVSISANLRTVLCYLQDQTSSLTQQLLEHGVLIFKLDLLAAAKIPRKLPSQLPKLSYVKSYCRLHRTCPGKESLSLAVARRAQPSCSTRLQVSYFAWARAM